MKNIVKVVKKGQYREVKVVRAAPVKGGKGGK